MSNDQVNRISPAVAELQGIVVFQAGQIAALHKQVIELRTIVLPQMQAVIESTEKVAEERLRMLQEQRGDLEAVHKFVGIGKTLEELVKSAHAAQPKNEAQPA